MSAIRGEIFPGHYSGFCIEISSCQAFNPGYNVKISGSLNIYKIEFIFHTPDISAAGNNIKSISM